MPELLFELGCEELPAGSVQRAYLQLREEVATRLDQAQLTHGEIVVMGTPRRLILQVQSLAERQPDSVKRQRGPSVSAAYTADGTPTKALEGFCRSQGVGPDQVKVEGDYVWAETTVSGRSTLILLAEVLPESIRALSFDKTMRWGTSRMRFARPIRWILACFDGALVEFEIEGVTSGLTSRGHRFNYPEPFEAHTLGQLVTELRKREVEPDAAVRESLIRAEAKRISSGTPEMPQPLVDENVFLTEWPMPLEGEFPLEFLELPEPVVVTAMAKHERFFPVRDAEGRLQAKFISVRNGGEEQTVRKGNQWVLNARFNDAKFFYDEDQKSTMGDFLERTRTMGFHAKLGSIHERSHRLSALATHIAKKTGADTIERQLAGDAGLYCKADLACGLVSELPSLQGVIGGVYGGRDGFHHAVCYAISTHYDPSQHQPPSTARERTALRVTMADHLDKLAGYLGIGLMPTGSSDPFGLRRSVSTLIEIALSWHAPLPSFAGMFDHALSSYARQGYPVDRLAASRSLEELFASRYGVLLPEFKYDVLAAACVPGDGLLAPRQVRFRAQAMEAASQDPSFVQAATRPLNIVSAALKKGVPIPDQCDEACLQSEEGTALAAALVAAEGPLCEAVTAEDPAAALAALREMVGPIHAFFDSTMVMVEEEAVRSARLSLLARVSEALRMAGDFTQLVVE